MSGGTRDSAADPNDRTAPGEPGAVSTSDDWRRLEQEIIECAACPRLVEWRERIGRERRRAFRDQTYWSRPVPGFGDREARLLILGLAPAAHGANRTGRIFTGDRSGDWLYAALHRAGFASQPSATHLGDGLVLDDAYITAAVKCAPPQNHPLPEERDRCGSFLLREVNLLPTVRVILCLGGFAWEQALRLLPHLGSATPSPRPRFGHGVIFEVDHLVLVGCYHPSQQNTFTGRLTAEMLDDVFRGIDSLLAGKQPSTPAS